MAIAPNTTFVSGAILTAAQQNAFGFGVVGYTEITTNTNNFSTIGTIISATFTAIANRYYKITYFERYLLGNGGVTQVTLTIANTALTALQESVVYTSTTNGISCIAMTVETFTAGSQTINARLTSTGGTNSTAGRAATSPAFLLIEDIGPA